MKNNFSKAILFLFVFFAIGVVGVSAKGLDELPDRTYVIGTHEFSPGTAITTQRIMLAAKTIQGEDFTLEDMIIYYKNIDGVWVNAVTGQPISTNELPNDFDIQYENDVFVGEKAIKLNDVKKAEVGPLGSHETMGTAHTNNQDAFTVTKDGNIVTVKENYPMESYDNGYLNKEWYGLVLDLNISLDKFDAILGYEIEDIDRIDGHLYGATKSSEVLLWLQGGNQDSTRYIVFKNTDTKEIVTVTILFEAVYGVSYTAEDEVEITSDNNVTYNDEKNMFIVDSEVTEFTFTDNGVAKTVINGVISTDLKLIKVEILGISDTEFNEHNQSAINVEREGNVINIYKNKPLIKHENGAGTNGEWYALLVNLTTLVEDLQIEGYTVEDIDREDVTRFGGVVGKDLIIWLNAETATRTITFKNQNNSADTLTITINVIQNYPLELKGVEAAAVGPLGSHETMGVPHTHNQNAFTVTTEDNTIKVKENDLMMYYDNGYANAQWYGILVDLNVPSEDIITVSGYTIEDIDRIDGHLYGAEGNQILLWLSGSGVTSYREIVFQNVISGEEITITIEFESVLVNAKLEAYSELATAFQSYVEEDYTEGNWIILTNFWETGRTAIGIADSLEAIELYKNMAIAGMASVEKIS